MRQQSEVSDFGAHEERRRGIGTHGDAGAAADAGGGVHGAVGLLFGNEDGIAVGRAAGGGGDVTAGGDQAVEGAAVHHEIFDNRKCFGAPRLEIELVAVLEVAHMELAEGSAGDGAVRHAIDHAAAHAADAFAAIVVERHRVFALRDQILIQDVEHLEKRHVLVDVRDVVADHAALIVGVALPPDVQNDSHYL